MAGIGKYTKGKAFALKSGNNPAFKMMGNPEAGDSPITNEFGIGKGTSPYRKEDEDEKKGGNILGKALGTLGAGLAGGLNAVYGSKIPLPKDDEKDEKEVTAKSEEEKLAEFEKTA